MQAKLTSFSDLYLRTPLQLLLHQWEKPKKRHNSPVICRLDLGNWSVLLPWIQAECVVETGAIGGTGLIMQSVQESLNTLGTPSPSWRDNISVLHYGWQNLFLPRNNWQLLEVPVPAQRWVAYSKRCPAIRPTPLSRGPPAQLAAALESGHADILFMSSRWMP